MPYGTAWERLHAIAYPEGNPYHHMPIGSLAHLDAVTLDDMHAFFRMHYRPRHAVLAVVGDFETAEAMTWIERCLGDIAPGDGRRPPAPDARVPARLGREHRRAYIERVPLARVQVAYRVPAAEDPDLPALDLAAALLGRGRGARLPTRLVRQSQVARDVSFGVQRRAAGASLVVAGMTVRHGTDPVEAEALLHAEIEKLAAEGPGDAELERARAVTERAVLRGFSQVANRAELLAHCAGQHGDPSPGQRPAVACARGRRRRGGRRAGSLV